MTRRYQRLWLRCHPSCSDPRLTLRPSSPSQPTRSFELRLCAITRPVWLDVNSRSAILIGLQESGPVIVRPSNRLHFRGHVGVQRVGQALEEVAQPRGHDGRGNVTLDVQVRGSSPTGHYRNAEEGYCPPGWSRRDIYGERAADDLVG